MKDWLTASRGATIVAFGTLAALLVLFALARPIDHDESQYVAAAVLAGHGWPYADFAYLQTPLQPILFAPLAAVAGEWSFAALRFANALLGAATILFVYLAARAAGVRSAVAMAASALLATSDILLFSAAVARNDALPAALSAFALYQIVETDRRGGAPLRALLIGLALCAAAATKLTYAFPAAAYGAYALWDRRHRPLWVALGALPVAALVLATWWHAPQSFLFDVFTFPSRAPADYYLGQGRGWKLSLAAKLVDTIKFLALGPALVAAILVARAPRPSRLHGLLDLMTLVALIAALLPQPTWRQYLLPVLPPLLLRLALVWEARAPGRATRATLALFSAAGIAPTAIALALSVSHGLPLVAALRDGAAIRAAMDAHGVRGDIATLAPQFLPGAGRSPDPRFATGSFYFRSRGLLSAHDERAMHLASARNLAFHFDAPGGRAPKAILTGGESHATAGNGALEKKLAHWALANGWRQVAIAGDTAFHLYLPPHAPPRLPARAREVAALQPAAIAQE